MQFGLSLVAVNIVLGDLGWHAPEPFHIPHPSRDTDERQRLREAVHRDLERRGLMSRGRLDAEVEETLRIFVASPVAVLVVGALEGEEQLFGRVAATQRFAVQALQRGQRLDFTEIRRGSLIPAAVSLLPGGVPAAPGQAVTVPVNAPVAQPGKDEDYENVSSLRAAVPTKVDAAKRALERLEVQPRLRVGLIMATVSETPPGGGALREVDRRSLTWFDTEDGRYMQVKHTGQDGAEWLTVTPADAGRIAQHLAGWIG